MDKRGFPILGDTTVVNATVASRAMRRGGATTTRKRRKKTVAKKRVRRGRRAATPAKRTRRRPGAKLTKGSAAAKAWGRRMKAARARKRR